MRSSIYCPVDGTVITEVPAASADDVTAVFSRARDAFPSWRRRPAAERGRLLLEAARLLRERIRTFADVETRNTGKPLHDTLREATRAADCFEYYGGFADKVTGDTIDVPGPFHTYTRREPYGVALGIIPWNAPYVFAAKKIAPALAFGNVSVLKPAEETPLSALMLADTLAEVGVPEGVAQVVTGGRETGQLLTSCGAADLIVFTGSDVTGRAVARTAGEHLTPVALELGGKSPQIVFADANLDAALEAVLLGVFAASGQMCIAGSRLLVQESVYDAFMTRVADRVRALRVGDPRVEGTQVGPQITAGQQHKTLQLIDAAVEEGAHLTSQAPLPQDRSLAGGFWAPPTLFTDVEVDMQIMREEVFGPVLAATRFRDEEHALELAHATDFGLAAGVWTSDLGRAHRMAAELNVGNVWLNTYRVLGDRVPFGGVGRSGYGREGGPSAVDLYTRVKSVWTYLQAGLPPGFVL